MDRKFIAIAFRLRNRYCLNCAIVLCVVALVVGAFCSSAPAAVSYTGSVRPSDNPFPVSPGYNPNEGLPPAGNDFYLFDEVDHQTYFEGVHSDGATLESLTDDENINFDVQIGITAFGAVLIDDGSALRFMDLMIGQQGTVNGVTRKGTGVLQITGFGSLYNNNPYLVPEGFPSNFESVNPRLDEPGAEDGFDAYIGEFGNGTLELTAGGRAEIQDAVVVGSEAGSTGSIIVDGIGSFLGSGGFDEGDAGDPHAMLIGRFGIGSMTISAGGVVDSEGYAGNVATNTALVAAVIGGEAFTTSAPEIGGSGTVTVTGNGSRWVIGGSLQIGGFDQSTDLLGDVIDGTAAEYASDVGRGILKVQDGGLVIVHHGLAVDDPEEQDLLLAIGRFGRLEMSGGVVSVGDPGVRQDKMMLLNDGVIQGSGRIETSVFRNRFFGEVRVRAGETLVVDATSEVTTDGNEVAPLANWGSIQVMGTVDSRAEIEFDRAPATPEDPLQPFLNLSTAIPPAIDPQLGGLISAQHATLRFRSGIENSGQIAFTAGYNYVTGNVFNPDGLIKATGPNTKVVFENHLDCGTGTCNFLSPGVTIDILGQNSFVTAGNLMVNLNPNTMPPITVSGDVGIAGKLTVSLSGFAPGSLSVGDLLPLISFNGEAGGVDFTDPRRLQVDLDAAPLFTQFSLLTPLASFGLPADAVLIPQYNTPFTIFLKIMSIGSASGPDFNGDGVVDLLDLAIWKANKGITSGATVLQGDADGDGDVDGQDFLIWQSNLGPVAGPGGGSGSSDGFSSVPEPTGLTLIISGGMLALALGRRKR